MGINVLLFMRVLVTSFGVLGGVLKMTMGVASSGNFFLEKIGNF